MPVPNSQTAIPEGQKFCKVKEAMLFKRKMRPARVEDAARHSMVHDIAYRFESHIRWLWRRKEWLWWFLNRVLTSEFEVAFTVRSVEESGLRSSITSSPVSIFLFAPNGDFVPWGFYRLPLTLWSNENRCGIVSKFAMQWWRLWFLFSNLKLAASSHNVVQRFSAVRLIVAWWVGAWWKWSLYKISILPYYHDVLSNNTIIIVWNTSLTLTVRHN